MSGKSSKFRILLNITHGFQARMFLRSSICEYLFKEGCEIVVVSPNADEPYFYQEFTHPQIKLELMPNKISRIENILVGMRQFLLMNPELGKTLNYKNEAYRRQHPLYWGIARTANMILGHFKLLRSAYLNLEEQLFPGCEFDELLQIQKPDLVVSGTPGVDIRDAHLIRAARRHGIPTATVMLSWDNLTSKGYMSAWPDYLLVWSKLMADEAVFYHNYPKERIFWSGAAQFDHYFGFRDKFDRTAWRRHHGVPPDTDMIFYGTINPAILPHEYEIVKQIAEAVETGIFETPKFLWIRLHPQVVKGCYAKTLEPYLRLASSKVKVEIPPVRSEKLAWDLPKEDNEHLASLLAASDIAVTPSSTLVIDAACVKTPSVSIFFDGSKAVSSEYSAKRFATYTHYEKILKTGGIGTAYSMKEFIGLINEYMKNRIRYQENTGKIVSQQLQSSDGKAGERTARILLEIAGGSHE